MQECVEKKDERRVSRLAVLALLLSAGAPALQLGDHYFGPYDAGMWWYVLGVVLVSGFLAVPVIAAAAFIRIHRRRDVLKGSGIAGSSLVLMGIGSLLAVAMYGTAPRSVGKCGRCFMNMYNLGAAFFAYTESHGGKWPAKENWCDAILKNAAIDSDTLRCPSDKSGPCSYAMNANLPETMEDTPEDMVILFESLPGKNMAGGLELAVVDGHRHAKDESERGCFVVLFHGHRIEFVKAEEIEKFRWKLQKE